MPFQFSCLSATERRSTAAKRDDLHSKSLFLVKNKGQWNAKTVQRQRMGILLCEQNFRDVWRRNESVGQKLVKFCTLTHAAKLVVRMFCLVHYAMVLRQFSLLLVLFISPSTSSMRDIIGQCVSVDRRYVQIT